jgi:glycosyltransferase involved in cell wall biosynthesis
MNILHIIPEFNYSCGSSYYVYQLLKYQKKYGNNVFLFSNAGDSFDRLDNLGINYFRHPDLLKKSIKNLLNSSKFLLKYVLENNIDIIHAHHRYSELITNYCKFRYKLMKVKTVISVLSLVDKKYFVEYKSDGIIANSNSVKENLISRFKLSPGKVKVISNCVDIDELNNIGDNLPPGNKINILSVGQFRPEKSFETVIRAISLLNNKNINYVLIGEGIRQAEYLSLADKLNVSLNIIETQKNLKPYFDNAYMCALPSTVEPFSGFMLQSGLHRKPFIGAAVDGTKELIDNAINGLLFEVLDYNGLARCIQKFISDSQLSESCAESLNATVLEKYTAGSVVPKILDYYKSLN